MRLVHFSSEPFLGPVEPRTQEAQSGRFDKPWGLWISDEDEYGWGAWCRESEFGDLTHATLVTLADEANVLVITNAEEFLAFEKEFGFTHYADMPRWPGRDQHPDAIRWHEVAEKYDGILITPYQWDMRHSSMWYYTWDCASGCIWHPRAVARIEPIKLAMATEERANG